MTDAHESLFPDARVESGMTQVINAPHYSASFEENAEGWYEPECNCGWKFGPVPDAETAVDALMQHAYEQGIIDQRAGRGV